MTCFSYVKHDDIFALFPEGLNLVKHEVVFVMDLLFFVTFVLEVKEPLFFLLRSSTFSIEDLVRQINLE